MESSQRRTRHPYGIQYQDAVVQFALSRGAKGAKLNVLRAILSFCNSRRGTAYPGNKEIKAKAGITSNDTRHKALLWLQEAKIIRAKRNPLGGRRLAVEWEFALEPFATTSEFTVRDFGRDNDGKTCPKNGQDIPSKNLPEKRTKPARKTDETCPKNGQPTTITNNKQKKGPAYGVARNDTPSRRDGANVSAEQRAEDTRQFSRWVDQYGYGRAREMERERDAARLAAE